MYPLIRAILVYLCAIFSALPRVRFPTPGTLQPPQQFLTLGNVFSALDVSGPAVIAPLWIPYPPDPLAKWAQSGKHGYWTFGSVNSSVDGLVAPYAPFPDVETEVFFGPAFEEHAGSTTFKLFESADTTADTANTKQVPLTDHDDPETVQRKVILWSALSFILIVAAVLPCDTPRLAKRWSDSISGKSALEADHGTLSDVLREWARVYEDHQAALAKHDEKWNALAVDIAAVDDWPLEDMHGIEGAQVALDTVLDKCDVAEARLGSHDVHYNELDNRREDEVVVLQVSRDALREQLDTLRLETADADRQAAIRAEAHKTRITKLKGDIVASQVKVQAAEEIAASASRELSTLDSTLNIVRAEKQSLEAENDLLRQCSSKAEETLRHNRLARQQKLDALRAAVAAQKAALQMATEREAAATARQCALQEPLRSATANARQVEGSLEADLSAKRTEVAALSGALAERHAATTDLQKSHQSLRSDHAAKTDRVRDFEKRIASVRDAVTLLRGQLEGARQARRDELSALTGTVAAVRSADAATAEELDAAEETLRQAEIRKPTEVGAAQAELDHTAADDKKVMAALKSHAQRQTRQLAALDTKQKALQSEQDSLETQGRELEACFDDHEPQWREMREEVEHLEGERKEQLEKYEKEYAEAEASQYAAEKAAKAANDEAVAAEKKSAADLEEHKQRQKEFDAELGRLRGANGTLASQHATLKSEHEKLKEANDSLVEQATTLPGDHAAALDTYAGFVRAVEAERDKKFTARKVTRGISRREALLENTKNTVACLQDTVEALDERLSEAHKELYDKERMLEKVQRALEDERKKIDTYRVVLQTPLTTPALANSSGRFSRSPSLTPPPETPRSNTSFGCLAVQDRKP